MTDIQRLDHDLEWAMRAMGTHRAVLVLDLGGHIVAVNQTCLGMCGYRREELIGRPVVILLDPSEKAPDRLRQVLEAPRGTRIAHSWAGAIDQVGAAVPGGRPHLPDS